MRPLFIQVIPAEVERYGANGAILLAHIRFRCGSDGPGRLTVEGLRWWRVPLAQLAHETGLSVAGVRTGLKALKDVVATEHFRPLSDQSRAYRVVNHENGADLPVADFNSWADLPDVENDISDAEIGNSRRRNQHLQLPKSTDVLPIKKLEKGENAAGAPPGEQTDKTAASQLSQRRPQKPANSGKAAPNGAMSRDEKRFRNLCTSVPAEPPPQTCATHAYWDGPDKCQECGYDRRAFKQWHADTILVLSDLIPLADNTRAPGLSAEIGHNRKHRLQVLDDLGLSRTRAGERA